MVNVALEILHRLRSNLKKYYFRVLYIIVSFMLTLRLSHSINGEKYEAFYLIAFIFLLLAAEYYKDSKIKKNIFMILSFVVFLVSVRYFNIDFADLSHISFFLITIYSYLIYHSIYINIIAIILVLLFLSYVGEADQRVLTDKTIGILTASITFSILIKLTKQVTEERDRYYKSSITDSLTGLATYDYAKEVAEEIFKKEKPLKIVIIDVDNFKLINDTYGHSIGNKVLIQIAALIKSSTMGLNGIASRLGGDEFILFFEDNPETQIAVRKLLDNFKDTKFITDNDLDGEKLVFSTGAVHSKDHPLNTIEELINKADKDMYYNKYRMKNYIVEKFKVNHNLVNGEIVQLLSSLREKDMYTYVHSQHTAQHAMEIAKKMGLDHKKVNEIYLAGLLHDIGKILIPNSILRNPNRLDDREFNIVKEHVKYGLNIIYSLNLSNVVKNGLLYHHERYDGKGYPNRIKGNDIPIEGRILQVADAYSAMTIKRLYRQRLSNNYALQEIKKHSGTQFDPIIVDVLCSIIEVPEERKMA